MEHARALRYAQMFNRRKPEGFDYVVHPTRPNGQFKVALRSSRKFHNKPYELITALPDDTVEGPPDDLAAVVEMLVSLHRMRWLLGPATVVWNDFK